MNNIIDFISTICPITGNSIVDTILFFAIGSIAFASAWAVTKIAASGVDYDSDSMSGIHWFVRIVVFLGLLGLVLGIVHLVRWFLSFKWWVYLIVGCSLLLIVVGLVFLHIAIKKKKACNSKIEKI